MNNIVKNRVNKTRTKKYNKKFSRKNKKGGKVIGSGGYGCIFFPGLKCKNSNTENNGISKLLLKSDANKEISEINKIKNIVNKIPNYNNYFLINNITKCDPQPLTSRDFENIENCKHIFDANNISYIDINNHLNKFSIINMPFGGISMVKLLKLNEFNISSINTLLINLLVNAIIPMNRLGLYHSDIKGENILFLDNNIRIIDWGISFSINRLPLYSIPNTIMNYKIQYNIALSRIMYNSYFTNFINSYLKKRTDLNPDNPKIYFELKKLSLIFYFKWIKLNGEDNQGHAYFFNEKLFPLLFRLNNMTPPSNYDFTAIIFAKFCATILLKYYNFNTKRLRLLDYTNDVFLKNLDIYGFISIYMEYILLNKHFNKNIIINISNILIKYCYSKEYSIKPIDINRLIIDIRNIDKISTNTINLDKLFKL